ncbi:MAG TPA: hypothetical protein VG273_09485 [Bryobacteraceae bacterium]|nr:hypothetical protein [Bryobacteraceae bacterium]
MKAALLSCLVCGTGFAQLSYSSGQSISPAYEGWDKNPDGSYNIIFGYMNSNWEEQIDVPIGPGNNIQPAGPDQGQPTHFFPRRNRFVFKVRVPADFGDKELVWTLTTHGKTIKAFGTLKQDFFVDDIVMASETGALGAGVSSPEIRRNKPPVVEAVGDSVRTAKVGEPLTLYVHVTDDGIPRPRFRDSSGGAAAIAAAVAAATNTSGAATPGATPAPAGAAPPARGGGRRGGGAAGAGADPRMRPPRQITVGSATGLWVSLLEYRGKGNVTFSPDQVKAWEDTRAGANSQWAPHFVVPPAPADGKWEAQVTFDEPGEYVLRWHASDGALTTDQDIKVNVTR